MSDNESLEKRVQRLEKETGQVRDELLRLNRKLEQALSGQGRIETRTTLSTSEVAHEQIRQREEVRETDGGGWRSFDLGGIGNGEWWLNKIGIGLLLFGVAFLYLLSVERGWISPPVRVGFGLLVGAALLAVGLHVYENRRAFSQVLLGGSIGAFYITGFAAFQLYGLVSYPVAFGFMLLVTLLAAFLSLRQNKASLALIGTLGGLGTPFVLYNGSESLIGLVLYTCIILAGTGIIYLYKGWASLLGVSFVGGWMVFLIGLANNISFLTVPSPVDQLVLQYGVVFAWLLFWIVPVAREVLRTQNPAAWPLPPQGFLARSFFGESGGTLRGSVPAYLMSVVTPLLTLAFTQAIWSFQSETLGWITLGGSSLFLLAALALRWAEDAFRIAYAQALSSLMLLTLALILILEGNALFFALAAEGAVLHLVARRLSDRIVSAGGHCLFFVVVLWLGARLEGGTEGFYAALVDLTTIALTFGVSYRVMPRFTIWAYRILAHSAFLAFLWRELSGLPGGDAYVTIAWGLYAGMLLVAGLRLDLTTLVRVGMVTFFLVVGKLFLVDLAQVDTVWRVVLFLGFGGLFLVLSYYLRSLWRPGTVDDHRRASRGT